MRLVAMPDQGLKQTAEARGSGAGMEPGKGSVLSGGWWRSQVAPPRERRELVLGASGAPGRLAALRSCHGDPP